MLRNVGFLPLITDKLAAALIALQPLLELSDLILVEVHDVQRVENLSSSWVGVDAVTLIEGLVFDPLVGVIVIFKLGFYLEFFIITAAVIHNLGLILH